jgi:hypothetical protein
MNKRATLGALSSLFSLTRSPSASRPTWVVIDGDPSTTIADVRKVETVFKQGVGYDPAKLIAAVTGRVGLW